MRLSRPILAADSVGEPLRSGDFWVLEKAER